MQTYITFVVAAYNAEQTLDRTLQSIVRQTSSDWKAIVVNDGSTDDTEKIGLDYATRYKDRITYVYEDNKGPGGARNHGISMVDTPYVSFLDSDDWLMPTYVETIGNCVSEAKVTPQIIMTLPRIYHEPSKVIRPWYDAELFKKVFQRDGYITQAKRSSKVYEFEVSQCRSVFLTQFLKDTGFSFREGIKWEDVVPHFYLLSKAQHIMGVGSVGFYYRIGSPTQTTASKGTNRLDFIEVMRDLVDYIEREHRDDIIFPAMRVIVRFSVWNTRLCGMDTRKAMVKALYNEYRKLPAKYPRLLWKGCIKNYPLKDALQYKLFWIAIRYPIFHFIFEDYLWQYVCEKLLKKILRAENHVS